jgi:cyclase
MLKKRIIFTLLYNNGDFVLSRNFRNQKVGPITWLQKNYDFSQVAFYIDELIVLDVTRKERNLGKFCKTLQELTSGCFVPIAAGGGIRSIETARQLLRSGADKVVVNTALFEKEELIIELGKEFGQQCIVGSVDVKSVGKDYKIFTKNGSKKLINNPKDLFENLPDEMIGEIYLNSIDQDGTGQGYDFEIINLLPIDWRIPVIIAGGVGNSNHLIKGLENPRVDAAATAHLFNFIGDGLKKARSAAIDKKIFLALWPQYVNRKYEHGMYNIDC